MGIKGGTFLGLAWFKNFSTRRIPFYLGGQYLTTAMNFYKNLSLIKVVLLRWNFLSLRNLASHYMSWSSKEIISLPKLYCCFEVVFLLKILLRALDMVVTEESSLKLSFSKKISRFKNVIRVTGTFCILYFAYSIFQIFWRKFPSNTGTNFYTFWLFKFPQIFIYWFKFWFLKLSCKAPGLYLSHLNESLVIGEGFFPHF